MRIVGNSGQVYDTMEAFYAECSATGNAWEECEFWKSWCWWKCKEMLPTFDWEKNLPPPDQNKKWHPQAVQ